MLPTKFPRLTVCLVISALLFIAALLVQNAAPGNILAVTIYKAHMASLAGWIGYWLDRWLFPYSRPHEYLLVGEDELIHGSPVTAEGGQEGFLVGSYSNHLAQWAMIRRAIIVAACLIAICLGA